MKTTRKNGDELNQEASRWATSDTLIEDCRRGDQAAWMQFYGKYTPLVIGIGIRMGLTRAAAEDLAQEVMTTLYVMMTKPGWRRDDSRWFRGLVKQVAKWQGLKDLATQRRQPSGPSLNEDPDSDGAPPLAETLQDTQAAMADDHFDRAWHRELLRLAFARLAGSGEVSQRALDVFIAVEHDEQPAEVVAERFCISVANVYVILHRVRKALRVALLAVCAEIGEDTQL